MDNRDMIYALSLKADLTLVATIAGSYHMADDQHSDLMEDIVLNHKVLRITHQSKGLIVFVTKAGHVITLVICQMLDFIALEEEAMDDPFNELGNSFEDVGNVGLTQEMCGISNKCTSSKNLASAKSASANGFLMDQRHFGHSSSGNSNDKCLVV